jgi:MFS family permease
MIIFLAGSTLCGAAPNSSSLVAGRAVAGIGAAGLLGGSGLYVFSLILYPGFLPQAFTSNHAHQRCTIRVVMRSVPMRYRGLLDSVIGAIYGISGVVAPLIGGALTTKTTWRYVKHLPAVLSFVDC